MSETCLYSMLGTQLHHLYTHSSKHTCGFPLCQIYSTNSHCNSVIFIIIQWVRLNVLLSKIWFFSKAHLSIVCHHIVIIISSTDNSKDIICQLSDSIPETRILSQVSNNRFFWIRNPSNTSLSYSIRELTRVSRALHHYLSSSVKFLKETRLKKIK